MGSGARLGCWFVAAVLSSAGCADDAPGVSMQCQLNSDCADPLVCREGRCVPECRTDQDCPLRSHCDTSVSVCVGDLPDAAPDATGDSAIRDGAADVGVDGAVESERLLFDFGAASDRMDGELTWTAVPDGAAGQYDTNPDRGWGWRSVGESEPTSDRRGGASPPVAVCHYGLLGVEPGVGRGPAFAVDLSPSQAFEFTAHFFNTDVLPFELWVSYPVGGLEAGFVQADIDDASGAQIVEGRGSANGQGQALFEFRVANARNSAEWQFCGLELTVAPVSQ